MNKWEDLRELIQEIHDSNPDKPDVENVSRFLLNYMVVVDKDATCDYTPFDVLNEISASYYGKQMFFLQENGLVYDRYKGDYTTFDDAVSRMAELVGDDGSC